MKNREKRNAYERAYQHQRYRERRQWALQYLGGRCAHCGATENLEIDHIDPSEKLFGLGKGWKMTFERLAAELDKCQLLCHGCHVKKCRIDGSYTKNVLQGEQIHQAKLTEDRVREARQLYSEGWTQQRVADRLGVTRGNIGQVVRRETWAHVV